jgi:hypothetical protein
LTAFGEAVFVATARRASGGWEETMRNALILLCLFPALALGAEQPNKTEPAHPFVPGVNWEARTIRATGRGAPNLKAPSIAAARFGAERAAELDAVRNILQTIQGVQINAGKTVGQALSSDGQLKASVEGIAKGFRRVDTRYFSDGGVEIDVEMGIDGLLAGLVPSGSPKDQARPAAATAGGSANTGLIVNASGLGAKPALAPRLLDQSGKELYGAGTVTRDAIKANGIAGYLGSVDQAKASARVGEHPLVIKALKAASPTELIISDTDAAKLRESGASYLAEGRVIIVAD